MQKGQIVLTFLNISITKSYNGYKAYFMDFYAEPGIFSDKNISYSFFNLGMELV